MTPDLIVMSPFVRAVFKSEIARKQALDEGRDWRRAKRIARQVFAREAAHKSAICASDVGSHTTMQPNTVGSDEPESGLPDA